MVADVIGVALLHLCYSGLAHLFCWSVFWCRCHVSASAPASATIVLLFVLPLSHHCISFARSLVPAATTTSTSTAAAATTTTATATATDE